MPKIGELTAVVAANEALIAPVSDGAATKKLSMAQLLALRTPSFARTAFVDLNGNDGNAVVGRLDKPYLTAAAALTALAALTPSVTAPCLLRVGPGTFDLGAGTLSPAAYVSITGSGRGVTLFTSSATVIKPGSHGRYRDCSFVCGTAGAGKEGVAMNTGAGNCVDVIFRDCRIAALNYGVNMAVSQTSDITLIDCRVEAKVGGLRLTNSGQTLNVKNVEVVVDGSSGTPVSASSGVIAGAGTLRGVGLYVTVSGGTGTNVGMQVDAAILTVDIVAGFVRSSGAGATDVITSDNDAATADSNVRLSLDFTTHHDFPLIRPAFKCQPRIVEVRDEDGLVVGADPLDATPSNRPNGTLGEIVYFDGALYFCSNPTDPEWTALT